MHPRCPSVNMVAVERRPAGLSATFNDALLPVTQAGVSTTHSLSVCVLCAYCVRTVC